MMKETALRIQCDILSKYPRALEFEKIFRSPNNELSWPSWCWLPMTMVIAIMTGGADVEQVPSVIMERGGVETLNLLAATLAWRQTKSIYRFDAELVEAMAGQSIDGDMPCDVLLRIPEWCMWIDLPGFKIFDETYEGFYVWLECDMRTDTPELRMLPAAIKGGAVSAHPIVLILGEGTLLDAENRLFESANKTMAIDLREMLSEFTPSEQKLALDKYRRTVSTLLNMVLYLCSEEPDIANYKPSVKRERYSNGPTAPRKWDVGLRIGSEIRKYRNAAASQLTEDVASTGHSSPRPHIRSAHWHTYRVGSGRTGLKIKWVAPILVGATIDKDELPAVVRRVK